MRFEQPAVRVTSGIEAAAIWFPPGEKHWHGATETAAMTHIAIQERLDGKTVEWMEKVT